MAHLQEARFLDGHRTGLRRAPAVGVHLLSVQQGAPLCSPACRPHLDSRLQGNLQDMSGVSMGTGGAHRPP